MLEAEQLPALAAFFAALADDLEQLLRLHQRELDLDTVDALQEAKFPQGLALLPDAAAEVQAWAEMAAAVAGLPRDADGLDRLAADFAAIYLSHRYGTSPCESVWLSDDHLACASPLFELRALYADAGLALVDRQQAFDDHLVPQLHYLAHRLRRFGQAPGPATAKEMAIFLDEHVGYWFPEFAARVVQFAACDVYAALAALTHVWLLGVRQLLGELAGYPPLPREVQRTRIEQKMARDKADVAPLRFMPGSQGASW